MKVERNGVIIESDSNIDGSDAVFSIRPFTEKLHEKRQPYFFRNDDEKLLNRFFRGMDTEHSRKNVKKDE